MQLWPYIWSMWKFSCFCFCFAVLFETFKFICGLKSLKLLVYEFSEKLKPFWFQKFNFYYGQSLVIILYLELLLLLSDSSDIVDGNIKLILGLMWSLILHYSISHLKWDDDTNTQSEKQTELTPKQRLLTWIQNKLPKHNITNFTTDWNDGRKIGALVDSVAPGKFFLMTNFIHCLYIYIYIWWVPRVINLFNFINDWYQFFFCIFFFF